MSIPGFEFDEASFRRVVACAVTLMRVLDDEQRARLFSALKVSWCCWCGAEQPTLGSCQCNNDE